MPHRVHDDEQGVALITVIGLSLVLALLVAALLQYGVGSMRQARYDQDWHASLAAADAGVDDFLVRINRDTDYWRDADDCADCSGTLDADNPALTGYARIPGGAAQYTYEVDASTIGSNGVLKVISTGRVNGVERTVRAELRRRGFLDFLYFTEYETLDPTAYPTSGSRDQTWAAANCSRHRYDSPARNGSCIDITWANDDTVAGPFHSNDQIAVSGRPTWDDSASTSRPDAMYYDIDGDRNCRARNNPSGCTSDPRFAQDLSFGEPLTLPPSNNQIKAEADPAIAGDGCMYVGATFIRLNPNGSATIRSATTDDASPGKCPINGTMGTLPDNGVIYVRSAKASEPCLSTNPHPYTTTGDVTSYNRCAGDVYVEGTLDGRLTIAAENNVIISNDIRYAGGRSAANDDMLGLVANNFVEIMHPVNSSGQDIHYLPGSRRFADPWIDAAILSVEHSFRVQNYNRGSAFSAPIDVYGTIAQLYRGPVGTFSGSSTVTGYEKAYRYDPRLEFISPPHFLDPVQSAWSVRSWSEE
jgi:hypothetical protein